MKTKNKLTTGILIGIGVIVLPLILMGTTNSSIDNEVGRYQISTCSKDNDGSSYGVYITILDTKTGKILTKEYISSVEY